MKVSKRTIFIIFGGVILLLAAALTTFLILSNLPKKTPPPSSSGITIAPRLAASGFEAITGIVATPQASDNRLFVVEQAGTVRSIVPFTRAAPKAFMDITQKVHNQGEMGLIGLVFHPDYKQNGFIFVNYINKQQDTVIARYHVNSETDAVEPESEKVILSFHQPHNNHNGGDLAFGPDGYLYAALGDGGSAGDPDNRAQNKGNFFGKILRLDINTEAAYTVPPTNPFVNEPGTKPEIWAYGLRNPWRISFDRQTGDLYIADVGQGNMEEIDFQPASSKGGQNYGWRCYEGTAEYKTEGCQPASNYTAPVVEYDHSDKRCSITGGYVYRGEKWPDLKGKYFYGDLCSGHIYYASRTGDKWTQHEAFKGGFSTSAFGQAGDGDLYFADIQKGEIYKIETADVQ